MRRLSCEAVSQAAAAARARDPEVAATSLGNPLDGPLLHHEHDYTQTSGKRPPTVLSFASVNEATAAAIRKATTQWRAILTTGASDEFTDPGHEAGYREGAGRDRR